MDNTMDFEEALPLMRVGYRMRAVGWKNGRFATVPLPGAWLCEGVDGEKTLGNWNPTRDDLREQWVHVDQVGV